MRNQCEVRVLATNKTATNTAVANKTTSYDFSSSFYPLPLYSLFVFLLLFCSLQVLRRFFRCKTARKIEHDVQRFNNNFLALSHGIL